MDKKLPLWTFFIIEIRGVAHCSQSVVKVVEALNIFYIYSRAEILRQKHTLKDIAFKDG